MAGRISKQTQAELLAALSGRYESSSKTDKGRILDEYVAVSGYHRKHAIRLLGSRGSPRAQPEAGRGLDGQRRIYDEAVTEALIVLWEAADRICGKRLKAIIPDLIAALERHGHLGLDEQVRERLLVVSENYPDLKATANFRELQAQLEGTENRITVERQRFNEAAQAFNTRRNRFPTVLIAGFFGDRFATKAYFQAQAGSDKAPEVKF